MVARARFVPPCCDPWDGRALSLYCKLLCPDPYDLPDCWLAGLGGDGVVPEVGQQRCVVAERNLVVEEPGRRNDVSEGGGVDDHGGYVAHSGMEQPGCPVVAVAQEVAPLVLGDLNVARTEVDEEGDGCGCGSGSLGRSRRTITAEPFFITSCPPTGR